MSTIILDPVFGLPPQSHVSDDMIKNSMPVMQILPGKPDFSAGLTLFRINTSAGIKEYKEILSNHGFSLAGNEVNLAFIADNFPTDTFTNEYGETFLQKFTDVASSGMQQIAQMTNATSGTQAVQNLGQSLKGAFEGVEGTAGSMLQGAASGMVSLGQGLEQLKNNIGSNSAFLGGALNSVDRMLAGHRVDFPMIWKNSAYTPSYTATIRLYNPNPGSKNYTKKYISGPLAAILCLALPQSTDGETFQWPFFHRIIASGIYKLEPAVITNVTVIKGGDQQQISYRQSLSMVDVRIDFTSIYNSMVLEKDQTSKFKADRPTVKKYIDNLTDWDDSLAVSRKQMQQNGYRYSPSATGPQITVSAVPTVQNAAYQASVQVVNAKSAAARKRQAPTVQAQAVGDRVDTATKAIQDGLVAAANSSFYSGQA